MRNFRRTSKAPMKALITSIYSPPEMIGIAKYTGEMCDYLAKNDCEVTLITTAPYYPQWKVWEGFSNRVYKKAKTDPYTAIICPFWMPKKISGATKMLHLLSFSVASIPSVCKRLILDKPDVVVVVYPYLTTMPFIYVLNKLTFSKTRIWLHIQDYELDAAFDLGIIKNRFLKRIGSAMEHWIIRRSDVVSTISEKMIERANEKGANNPAVYFPNWVDTDVIYPGKSGQESKYMDLWSLPSDKCIALYSGNIGSKQGLEIIVEAARALSDSNVYFVIAGEGPNRERLVELAAGLNNICFQNLVPQEELNSLLNLADIHMLPQEDGIADLVLPSKLLGMMASGRPIVCTSRVGTQLATIVTECGLVVEPNNVGEFSDAIRQLSSDPRMRATYGCRGHQLVEEKWAKTVVLKEFLDRLTRA